MISAQNPKAIAYSAARLAPWTPPCAITNLKPQMIATSETNIRIPEPIRNRMIFRDSKLQFAMVL
jgi:hypothetical protein